MLQVNRVFRTYFHFCIFDIIITAGKIIPIVSIAAGVRTVEVRMIATVVPPGTVVIRGAMII